MYCSFSGFDSYRIGAPEVYRSCSVPGASSSTTCRTSVFCASQSHLWFLGKNPKLATSTFWRTWRHAWTIMSTTPLYWTQAGNAGMQRESCLNPPEHWIERDYTISGDSRLSTLRCMTDSRYLTLYSSVWVETVPGETVRLTLRDTTRHYSY